MDVEKAREAPVAAPVADPEAAVSTVQDGASSVPRSSSSSRSVEYKVYFRRHLVLMSYALTMCAWNAGGLRQTAIVPSYAAYHGITNELSAPPIWGVDSFTLASNVVTIFSYLPASYAIDRWGLRCISVGAFLLCITSWAWYFSGTNTTLVVLSISFAALVGPLVSTSILAISNRWYPPHERVKATAIGGLIATIGAGAPFVVSPMFGTQADEVVDTALKSCKVKQVAAATITAFEAAKSAGEQLLCKGEHLDARDSFCCYLPADIPKLNLAMALASTVAFVFSAVFVRSLPPTPPAPSGEHTVHEGMFKSMKRLFANQRFSKLALSDFLVSGPPLVAVSTVSRLFPARIAGLAPYASVGGMALAIPATVVAGHFLDKTKHYWTYTMAGYATGTFFWIIATICVTVDTLTAGYVMIGTVSLTLATYICWQAAVFETKLEYVFVAGLPLEGIIVASDRIVINLSSLLFLAVIPPERVGGARNTFLVIVIVVEIVVKTRRWELRWTRRKLYN